MYIADLVVAVDFGAKQVVLQHVVKDPDGLDFVAVQLELPHRVKDPGGLDVVAEQAVLPDSVPEVPQVLEDSSEPSKGQRKETE